MRQRATSQLVGRLLAEFAIIFVGVVLAFQFENWREDRQDLEREQEQLEALLEDFRINQVRLNEVSASQDAALERTYSWLEAVATGEHDQLVADAAGPDYAPWLPFSWYTPELASGSFDALIASGDIGLLSNRELRRRLAEFYGVLNAGFEDHDDEMNSLDRILGRLSPYLGQALSYTGQSPRSWDSPPPEVTEALVVEMLSVPELHGEMAWKVILSENRMEWIEWLDAQADTIAGILEGELSR